MLRIVGRAVSRAQSTSLTPAWRPRDQRPAPVQSVTTSVHSDESVSRRQRAVLRLRALGVESHATDTVVRPGFPGRVQSRALRLCGSLHSERHPLLSLRSSDCAVRRQVPDQSDSFLGGALECATNEPVGSPPPAPLCGLRGSLLLTRAIRICLTAFPSSTGSPHPFQPGWLPAHLGAHPSLVLSRRRRGWLTPFAVLAAGPAGRSRGPPSHRDTSNHAQRQPRVLETSVGRRARDACQTADRSRTRHDGPTRGSPSRVGHPRRPPEAGLRVLVRLLS